MFTKQNKFLIICFILIAIVLGIISALMFYKGHKSFVLSDVKLSISAPESIASGDKVSYIIKYANNTKVVLKDAEIIFQYPDGFFPDNLISEGESLVIRWNLGDIEPGFQDNMEVTGILIGQEKSVKQGSAVLRFKPRNFNSQFEKTSEVKTVVNSVPILLTLNAPKEVSCGQTIEYLLDFKNVSETIFKNLRVELEYPDGFTFEKANLEPIESNNIWQIEEIKPGEISPLKIKGVMTGEENQIKSVQVAWGQINKNKFIQYNQISFSTKISLPLLDFTQTINGSEDYKANIGDTLRYKIRYKNNSDKDIRDLTIICELSGSSLELDTLESQEGIFDGEKIVWSSFLIPRLALLKRGAEGEVDFKIKMKNELPIKDSSSKNFTIENSVRAEGFISEKGDKIEVADNFTNKVNSRLIISQKGYYNDDGRISNFGPIPPQVGEKTSYTIHWQLLNLANDLEKVEVQGTIPSWVNWEGKVIADDSDFHFDRDAGKIIWTVGDLPANTGIFLPVKEIVFQVSITPKSWQVGDFIMLASEVVATGFDTFTGEELMSTTDVLTTRLPDDLSIEDEEGRVVE